MAERDQPLRDERAVQPGELDHVADGPECDEFQKRQQVGKCAGEIPAPKFAQKRDGGKERHPDRRERPLPGDVVAPVRIDDGDGGRQLRAHLVMIEHDDVDAARLRALQRIEAGRAAIDADDQPRALPGERVDRVDVGSVALEDAVGDVDARRRAERRKHIVEKRGGGRAVDVVVAEDRDRLVRNDSVGEPSSRFIHVDER